MKKISLTLLFTLLISICQPSFILAETIDSSTPKISNDSKEAIEDSSEEAIVSDSSESSETIKSTELSNSQDKTGFTVLQDTSAREVSAFDVSTTDIATGTFGTSDWSIDDTGVLHIQQGEFDDTPEVGAFRQSPWFDYRNSINKIVFEGPVVASAIMERLFESLSNVTEIENISYLDTSNAINMERTFADCTSLVSLDLTSWNTSKVQDIFSIFNGCVNMENLDVSTWDTQSITAITYAFASMTKLKALNLSNWKLSPMNSAQGVFMEDSSLESLDLSGFDMTKLDSNNAYSTSRFFQDATALKELTLSSSFRFIGRSSLPNPELPMIPANDTYTGMWQNIGEGTRNNPKGTDIWTSQELMSNFDLAPRNDTYVWQPVTRAAADVTVIYLDETGEEIHMAQPISGNIGDSYDATIPAYKLEIDGYTLDESRLPENAKGTLSETAQTVVYNYTKNPV
ncbi:BspA family leucine-rich repeat surface protein, partial [Enterococcus caccae]